MSEWAIVFLCLVGAMALLLGVQIVMSAVENIGVARATGEDPRLKKGGSKE